MQIYVQKPFQNISFKYGNLKNVCRVSTLRGVHVSTKFLVKYLTSSLYIYVYRERTAKCIVKKFRVENFTDKIALEIHFFSVNTRDKNNGHYI
jgi:hypothetical protein